MASRKYLIELPTGTTSPLSIRAKVLVFEDPNSQKLLQRVRKVAPSGANVIIIGETGTGKELLAREIHNLSDRRNGPFIAVNCGAFSETLIESELFGHDKGSFTGAISSKSGWFEEANGGTLFLDEIGDMPYPLQVKMLRVIQERQVVRLGSRKTIDIDVRIIAATNVNLEDAVNAGRFREDLYYRLNVVNLNLLPLKDRPKDILPLVNHFMGVYAKRLGIINMQLSPEAIHTLVEEYTWPGNIRELENVIHQSLLVCRGNIVKPEDLNLSNKVSRNSRPQDTFALNETKNGEQMLREALAQLFEENHQNLYSIIDQNVFQHAFEYCYHNQMETSRLLNISRNILRSRLIEYGHLNPKLRSK